MNHRCYRDSDGNVIDPITLEPIPDRRLVKVFEHNNAMCFDIKSLATNAMINGSYENPLTRQQFPRDVIRNIDRYILKNSFSITDPISSGPDVTVFKDTRLFKIPLIIMKDIVGNLGGLFDYNILFVDKNGVNHSIYEYDLGFTLEDIRPESIQIQRFDNWDTMYTYIMYLAEILDLHGYDTEAKDIIKTLDAMADSIWPWMGSDEIVDLSVNTFTPVSDRRLSLPNSQLPIMSPSNYHIRAYSQ